MTNIDDKNIDALLNAAGAPAASKVPGDAVRTASKEGAAEEIVLVDTKPNEEELRKAARKLALTDADSVEESTAAEAEEEPKTIEELVQQEAKESDDQPVSSFSLSRTLGGAIVAKAVQKQIGLVLVVAVFLIIYITNRYVCQQQIVKIDKLERQLVEIRFKATVATSELTERSRESNIIKMLEAKGDSTLTVPTTPPYILKIEK